MKHSPTAFLLALTLLISACGSPTEEAQHDTLGVDSARLDARVRPSIYVPVKLNTDLSVLNATDRQLLPLFISVADIMDSLFWQEAWGRPDSIPMKHPDIDAKAFFTMNYGPWDRLAGDRPFIDGVGEKPKGARFYPKDMTAEEFDAWGDSAKQSQYTVVLRNMRV